MRVGATRWDGSAECQGNFAGCVKTILPPSLPDASTTHRRERPVIVARAVLARSMRDQGASGPKNVLDSREAWRHKYSYNYGRPCPPGPQGRRPPPARDAQSAPRGGARPALRPRRVLRRPRSRPGQVRDGAPRARRRPRGEPERQGLRLFAPGLLSRPARPRPRRARRPGAAEARPPPGAQAAPGGAGVPRARARRGSCAAGAGPRPARAGPVRLRRASAQHRARLRAGGKKRP